MAEPKDLCVKPARGPIAQATRETSQDQSTVKDKGDIPMGVKIGKEAPDFEASAFVDGGFKNIRLSDYRGKWVVLCFYPGDFTFV